MSRHCHSQVWFSRMPKLRMASCLMMNLESCLQQGAEYFLRFQNRQAWRHLRRQRDTQFLFASLFFVGDALSVFAEPLQMATNRVAGHLARLVQRSPVSDQPGQQGNRNLISRPRRILGSPHFSAVPHTVSTFVKGSNTTVKLYSRGFKSSKDSLLTTTLAIIRVYSQTGGASNNLPLKQTAPS